MITTKRYLEALEIINKYNAQTHANKTNINKYNNKILVRFDDALYSIEIDGDDTKFKNSFEFAEVLDILLTTTQKTKFIEKDTNRDFFISKERIGKMLLYIESDSNIWRTRK